MMKFVADLALDLKVATLTLTSGAALGVADALVNFDSALPKIASVVTIITGIVICTSHYCKMVWDNRHARAEARLKELAIAGEQKDNKLKDELIKEQKLKNKLLEKEIEDK